MATKRDPKPAAAWNYEATVIQVEAILNLIEGGDLALADVFDQFIVAADYLQQCEQFLTERQEQVDLLIETLSDD
jgi:exodeoxyribonuclease VII small subunit